MELPRKAINLPKPGKPIAVAVQATVTTVLDTILAISFPPSVGFSTSISTSDVDLRLAEEEKGNLDGLVSSEVAL